MITYAKPKIKILDNDIIRQEIFTTISHQTQVKLSLWAIDCAIHVTRFSPNILELEEVHSGIQTLKLWQDNKASVHEVRQAGFKIHQIARAQDNVICKFILRTLGQCVGVGHMREHAIVCSDYAIKVVQLSTDNNIIEVTTERSWQLQQLHNL